LPKDETKHVNEKYPEKGFTLLELMASVAIVGTLSTLAMPLYNDYVAKSQVAEGFVLMGPCMLATIWKPPCRIHR
jgi:prepilin-type N-terminal cleavage/methylation domain-containing protein